MARKDRHTLFVGDGWDHSRLMNRSQGAPENESRAENRSSRGKRSATSIFPQPFGVRIGSRTERLVHSGRIRTGTDSFVKGLILAQNERWRRGLGMQVERAW